MKLKPCFRPALLPVILLTVLMPALFSCSGGDEIIEEGGPGEATVKAVAEFVRPADDELVELTDNTGSLYFSWVDAAVEGVKTEKPAYTVLFDKKGGNFSNPIAEIASGNSGTAIWLNISYSRLKDICMESGMSAGDTGTLIWTVKVSYGTQERMSTISHKLRFAIISEPEAMPQALFITGEGSEAGTSIGDAIGMRRLSDGVFEAFTKISANQAFIITDSKDGEEMAKYGISDEKIKLDSRGTTVPQGGIYRIVVNFNTNEALMYKVKSFGLYSCVLNSEKAMLEYTGKGTWGAMVYVHQATVPGWGPESRYKFQMVLTKGGEEKTVHWGKIEGPDSKSMIEVPAAQWDGHNWGFETSLDKKNIEMTVSLSGDSYSHSYHQTTLDAGFWETAPDNSTKSFIKGYWNSSRSHFNNDYNGTVGTYDYWPEAHGIDVIIDAYLRTRDDPSRADDNAQYAQVIAKFNAGVKAKNGGSFYNNFYDDMAWHLTAHLRAYQATGDVHYKNSSNALFGFLTDGLSADGSIPWNHETTDGNRLATGPSCIYSARMWREYGASESFTSSTLGKRTYKEYACLMYDWLMNNSYDRTTGRAYENHATTNNDYSYDAALLIGASLEMYNNTGEQEFINEAVKIADYFNSHDRIHEYYGIIREYGEQYPDHDVNLFKAIYVRYLTQLIMHPGLPAAKRAEYIAFLAHQAQYAWFTASTREPYITYCHAWYHTVGADNNVRLRAQISGCALIEAMAALSKNGFLQ